LMLASEPRIGADGTTAGLQDALSGHPVCGLSQYSSIIGKLVPDPQPWVIDGRLSCA
jgi:hypothetical protein